MAFASPQFMVYEGRNSVHDGQGGERKTVNGIDFWYNGDPPRRYQVLGSIDDRRMKTGIYGMIRMSGLDTDIAKTAKAAGGDAVILENAGDDVLGIASSSSGFVSGNSNGYVSGNSYNGSFSGSGFGSSFARQVKAHVSRYVVVKYLADDPAAASASPPVAIQPPPTTQAAPPPGAVATPPN